MLVFFTPKPIAAFKLGEEISGRIAGSGSEGPVAGDADRRNDGDDPNDDRRLCENAGGSIGSGVVRGVPGFEGAGDTIASFSLAFEER
jgi:hypothetical protein